MQWMKMVHATADAGQGRDRDVTPPPSAVAGRIAKRIGEAMGRDAADDVRTETTQVAHPHAHDEAHEAEQRYLENRPGPHS